MQLCTLVRTLSGSAVAFSSALKAPRAKALRFLA